MDKLRFSFTILQGDDGKSNIYAITSITTEEGKVFKIPEELQAAGVHKLLIETNAFKKVKNSFKKRHHTRQIWIKLTKELRNIYVDETGNLQF